MPGSSPSSRAIERESREVVSLDSRHVSQLASFFLAAAHHVVEELIEQYGPELVASVARQNAEKAHVGIRHGVPGILQRAKDHRTPLLGMVSCGHGIDDRTVGKQFLVVRSIENRRPNEICQELVLLSGISLR